MEWVLHLLQQAHAAGIESVYAKANLRALRGYPGVPAVHLGDVSPPAAQPRRQPRSPSSERVKRIADRAQARADANAQPQPSVADVALPSLTEEDVLKIFKGLAHSKRNHPLPKGLMIDSGNGPEPAGVCGLGTVREEWRETYQRAWDKLSRADQEILADYVSQSGIGTPAAPTPLDLTETVQPGLPNFRVKAEP
jgi:hypothetical protein